MALIKLTAVVDNISGKLNGTVFARNKGGHYMRSKSNPTNPQTDAQIAVRGKFSGIASLWRTIPESIRTAWNDAAPNYPYQNRLGDTKFLSGFGLFMKLNQNLLLAGQTVDEDRALIPTGSAEFEEFTANEFVVPDDPGPVAFDFHLEIIPSDQANTLLIFATPPFSAGINNFRKQLRVIGTLPLPANSTAIDNSMVNDLYEDKYGIKISAGSKIGLGVRAINNVSGEASVMVTTSAVVTEA